ncbi:hypothetical protein Vadar_003762 [Vaccinium darrowii]|uniref:Uncharacterized protein n=1 Tax=Vaccinium darrowii TaxID=229202 RepID=A0ACB7X7T2_9ERIC|nr:hypothetical protein Vadar_003762 [Vaccinium darrowii]
MSDFSESEGGGSESSGSIISSEFVEERLDVNPPSDLPEFKRKGEAGEILGQALGEDVTVDIDDFFPRHFHYLRVNIFVTPDSILVPGFFLDIPGGEPRWIECRYERIYKFCRLCGRIGHTYPQCDLSREEARARVDAMLNNLCTRFGSVLHTDDSAPLYSNRIRAFARSNARRNMHMWAADDNVAEVATQTDVIGEQVDEQPLMMDFEQFLQDYEAAWDLGLQRPNADVVQVGNLVVVPTSPRGNNVFRPNDTGVDSGRDEVGESRMTDLVQAINRLDWVLEDSAPTAEVMDQCWLEWESTVSRYGFNAGSWSSIIEGEGLVREELNAIQDGFVCEVTVVDGAVNMEKSLVLAEEDRVLNRVAAMGLSEIGLKRRLNKTGAIVIREPTNLVRRSNIGCVNYKDPKGKRPVEELDEDSDSSTNSGPCKRWRGRVISGPNLEGCSNWAVDGPINLDFYSGPKISNGPSFVNKVGLYRRTVKKALGWAKRKKLMRGKTNDRDLGELKRRSVSPPVSVEDGRPEDYSKHCYVEVHSGFGGDENAVEKSGSSTIDLHKVGEGTSREQIMGVVNQEGTRQRVTEELQLVAWDRAISILAKQLKSTPLDEDASSFGPELTIWDVQVEEREFHSQLAEEMRQYVWERCRDLNRGDSDDANKGVLEEVLPYQPPPSP